MTKRTWFGRCIFIGWFCERGSCKFCFRSTTSHKKKHSKKMSRSMASMIADTVVGVSLGWKFEYLTGGYANRDIDEIVSIAKNISKVYGEKIWVNLGVLGGSDLDKLKPYVCGVCASIETIEEKLHDSICPDKPIEPYLEMLKLAKSKGFKVSATIVIGLGEKKKDFSLLKDFISENKLDRITFYALKPVKGTEFDKSPSVSEYVWWIKKTRESFPELEIICGLTPKKVDYVKSLLENGATAITKFPAVRKFNSKEAKEVEKQIKDAGFEFVSSLTKLPKVDWDKKIDSYGFDKELTEEVKEKVSQMVERMKEK